MEFRLLGPVELWADDGRMCELGSAKERYILAILLRTPGKPVSIEAIIDRVWGEQAPTKARASVHTYIARLRGHLHQQLGDDLARVESRPGAYVLQVDPDRVDVHRFERLYAQARAIADSGDGEDALRLLRQAEELWRGEPLAGLSGEWAVEFRASLEHLHRAVVGQRLRLELEAGRHLDVVGELYSLVAEHPYDESAIEYLMVALYRCGRPSDALEVYHQARRRLADDLGTDPGLSLRGVYEHILRGDPELAAPPLRQRVPAVSLADNLPRDIPGFTGREAELSRLYATLEHATTAIAIAAVDGMAGIGKSALALHAAHQLADRYPDGRLYLHLHAHDPNRPPLDPADGLETLLRLIGEDPQRIPATVEERAALWRTRLANRRALIVLDDVADSRQVGPFLPGASGCLVLITSRRRLTGLDGVRPISLEVLEPGEAALLFRRIVGDDRRLDVQAVKELIRACGYLPLAVAIMANQLRHRPARGASDLLNRLARASDQLAEIHAGDTDLSRAFDLSYRALSPARRRAFRRLSLYVGDDLTIDAVAALIGCDRTEAEDAVEELIDYHLVQEPHSGRIRFHDLLRAYAAAQAEAEEPDEVPRAVRRLLDFYLHTADRADRCLYPHRRRNQISHDVDQPLITAPTVQDPRRAQEWLAAERINLLACADYAASHGSPAHAVLLSQTLATYLERSAHWQDAARLHQIAHRICQQTGDRAGEAHADLELCLIHSRTGSYATALEHARHALTIFTELKDRRGEADTYDHLARACWLSGRNHAALSNADQALALFRVINDQYGEVSALLHKGIALSYLGKTAEAIPIFEEALQIARAVGDSSSEALILNNLGDIKLSQGYHRDALKLFHESLTLLRTAGWRQNEALALNNIANVLQYKARHSEALHFYREALAVHRETGDLRHEADALNNIGTTFLNLEQYPEALIHFQKAWAIAQTIGDLYEQARALHRIGEAQRGTAQFRSAQDSYERALAIARELADPHLEARCMHGLGETLLYIHGMQSAEAMWRQAITIFERLGVPEAETLRVRLQALRATGS